MLREEGRHCNTEWRKEGSVPQENRDIKKRKKTSTEKRMREGKRKRDTENALGLAGFGPVCRYHLHATARAGLLQTSRLNREMLQGLELGHTPAPQNTCQGLWLPLAHRTVSCRRPGPQG